MSASAARIRANQANAALSTGPKTVEGKANSRANSYKHALTGAGVVIPDCAAAEVERRCRSFAEELHTSGDLGVALVRRAASMSVRMERCVEHEAAAIAVRVRLAMDEFVPPEGTSAPEADQLRLEVGKLAAFDPSDEASLARRYEAASERSFFRALKELRQMARQAQEAEPVFDVAMCREVMGSFEQFKEEAETLAALYPGTASSAPRMPDPPASPADLDGPIDVPFTIGRRR